MPLTRLLIAVENARQAAIRRTLDEDAAISSILQDADVAREVDAVARERAHGLWLVNHLRDQDAPHDAAATVDGRVGDRGSILHSRVVCVSQRAMADGGLEGISILEEALLERRLQIGGPAVLLRQVSECHPLHNRAPALSHASRRRAQ
jgi:predicted hydrolase (HD superfamily)